MLSSKRTSRRKLAQVVTFKYCFPLCCPHFEDGGIINIVCWMWSTQIEAQIGDMGEHTFQATTQNT
jgi:hypothetical protein